MKTWGPAVILLFAYSSMKMIAGDLDHVYIKGLYDLELFFFGWLFDGQIPAFWFQNYQYTPLVLITAIIYSLHIFIPIFLAILVGYISDNKEALRFMIISLVFTCFLAFVTFTLFPTAAPWYVDKYGYVQPSKTVGLTESAGGLLIIDDIFNIKLFGPYYENYNADPFAAFPSMHSGFSFFSAFYFIKYYKHKSKFTWLALLYPLSVWFSAVYLQHHYIVDLIAGAIYVLTGDWIARVLFRHFGVSEARVETSAEPEIEPASSADRHSDEIDAEPLVVENIAD
jgi:membrane-associated phospholipid phosphatase